ncbi:MAG TPA: hypothetical protein V6C97_19275 [Oculatellaceae cyanobacterium]
MASNEALLKRRAALESVIQDCATAGVEPPESTQQEFEAVLAEIDQLGLDIDAAQAEPKQTTWTDWLGKELDGYLIKHLLLDDSYSFLMEGASVSGEAVKKVFRIAKDKLSADSQEHLRLTHGTQCLRLLPFDTAPITVATNDLIDVQFERLADIEDTGFMPVEHLSDEGKNHFYRMPFIQGRSLKEIIGDKSMPGYERIHTALRTVASVAKTLHRLCTERADFYHGNIKPQNIWLTDTGTVLSDPGYFGPVSALEGDYQKGMVSTIAYYPFLEADDMLALGICLYEAVTGVHPFNQRMVIPGADESFEPTRLSAELCDKINFRRSLLEPYTTPFYLLQPPQVANKIVSPAVEAVALKALRARIDRNGTIHSDPGFADFQEMRLTVQSILESELDARDAREREEALQEADAPDEQNSDD